MTRDEMEMLLSIINAALNGVESSSDIQRMWKIHDKDFVNNRKLGETWSILSRFLTDADIRETDKIYDAYLRETLNSYVKDLTDELDYL